eukprot:6089857-Amphidinium_carterae.2
MAPSLTQITSHWRGPVRCVIVFETRLCHRGSATSDEPPLSEDQRVTHHQDGTSGSSVPDPKCLCTRGQRVKSVGQM